MGILAQGFINRINGELFEDEIGRALDSLEEGEHKFIIFDNSPNPTLPAFKYITGYLVPEIATALKNRGYDINSDALYRMFEKKFTPLIIETVVDEEVSFHNMKGLKTKELSEIASKIIAWSDNLGLGIDFTERQDTKKPQFSDKYASIYINMWKERKRKYNI